MERFLFKIYKLNIMRNFLMLICFLFINLASNYSQDYSNSDTLVFEYDDSYLTVFKHTPDCYFIADVPIGKGFCFQYEKKEKLIKHSRVIKMRKYFYELKEISDNTNYSGTIDIDVLVRHLRDKTVYLKKDNDYIKVNAIIYAD